MDQDQQRDHAEESYNRAFCDPCGASPCTWNGLPDGFHTDAGPGDTETLTHADAVSRIMRYTGQPEDVASGHLAGLVVDTRTSAGRTDQPAAVGMGAYMLTYDTGANVYRLEPARLPAN